MTSPLFLVGNRALLAGVAFVLAAAAAAQTQTAPHPVYRWSTLAGINSRGAEDGTQARFSDPRGLAMDVAGNLFVADSGNHTVRRITPDGVVSTLAGAAGQPGAIDGTGGAARFRSPQGVAVDEAGNVYVADTGNHTIRKITPAGVVTTLAGEAGAAGTLDGAAASARFDSPASLTADRNGNVFVLNGGLRKISGGMVQTLALSPLPGTSHVPQPAAGPAVDAAGALYFYDTSHNVVRVDPAGTPTIIVSATAYWGTRGTVFNDIAGRIFLIRDQNYARDPERHQGWQLGSDGSMISTAAILEDADGYGIKPLGLAVDSSGRWYYTRGTDHAVLRGRDVFAGRPRAIETVDGPPNVARFESIYDLALDSAGNVWAQESNYHLYNTVSSQAWSYSTSLRRIAASDATVTTELAPDFRYARFEHPLGLGVSPTGVPHVALVQYTSSIFAVPTGESFTPEGSVSDFTIDSSGNLWAFTWSRSVVRRPAGGDTWTVVAGPSGYTPPQDGQGAAARFGDLKYLTGDSAGNCYGLDFFSTADGPVSCFIRRITPAGAVTSIGKNLLRPPDTTRAKVEAPSGFALAGQGKFVVTYRHHVVQLDSDGNELTLGGRADGAGSFDGIGDAARFDHPSSVVATPQGHLFVADGQGSVVRKGEYLGMSPGISAQPQNITVAEGGTVSFSVTLTETPDPIYQWYFNGSPFSGGTSRTLTFNNARTSDAGDYHVVITNARGSVTSAKARLTVAVASAPPTQPSNSGGGGAPSLAFLAVIAGCGALRCLSVCIRRRR